MEKTILIAALALMTGLVLVGEVFAQGSSSPGVFSGTITKVDPEEKGIVVQNKDGEMFFQFNYDTKVNGSPLGKGGLIFEKLKEGMPVTILFMEGERNRVASRIDVKPSSVGSLKGWEFPFVCGLSIC